MEKKTFYRKDSKDKIRVWTIRVDVISNNESHIITEDGVLGGKLKGSVTPITEGKNIGKINETSPYEQAVKDAYTEIDKKEKKGYGEDINNLKKKGQTLTIEDPMKGVKFQTYADGHAKFKKDRFNFDRLGWTNKRIAYFLKYDGWRFRFEVSNEGVITYSASGDIQAPFPQIDSALTHQWNLNRHLIEKLGVDKIIFDGEIYNHELGFNAVQQACGTSKNLEKVQHLRDAMQFVLFDFVNYDMEYEERYNFVSNFADEKVLLLAPMEVMEATNENAFAFYEKARAMGYEGTIMRTLNGPYEHKHSRHMCKWKPKEDAEFKVVGFLESIQKNTLGSIDLVTADGTVFNSTLKDEVGTKEYKKYIWDNQHEFLGKWAKVEFMEYTTAKDTPPVPRHPHIVAFRSEADMTKAQKK